MSLKKYFKTIHTDKKKLQTSTVSKAIPEKELKPDDDNVRIEFRTLKISEFQNKSIFLSANAGSGKTYEIFEFLKQHREYSTLLISYTKSVVVDIKKRLTDDLCVDVMTFDSLAFRNRNSILPFAHGSETYNSLYSARKVLCKAKGLYRINLDEYEQDLFYLNKDELKNELAKIFKYCMKHSINNVYINKLLMLYNYTFKKYDIIIVDEAQDLENIKRKILKSITNVKAKIYVGDPKQSLYCKKNVFDNIDINTNIVFNLTHTFRYGKGLVNFLNLHNCEEHTCYPTNTTQVMECSFASFYHNYGANVILISAWKNILKYVDYIENLEVRIDPKAMKEIQTDINKHKEYVKFHKQFLRSTGTDEKVYFESFNKEYLLEYKNEKWEQFVTVFNRIKSSRKRKRTGVLITTVHRAKGLQYDCVFVDKSCHPLHNTNPSSEKTKENIYYTALTRCKYVVAVSCNPKYIFGSYKRKDRKMMM